MTLLILVLAVGIAPPDTVTLAALQEAAVETDPRRRQIELNESITSLRTRNLDMQHRPALSLGGQASYQSEVPSFGTVAPGVQGPQLSKDHYQVSIDVDQVLYDGGAVALQRELEETSRDVQQQSVRVDLYALREQVNEAYFAALLSDARAASIDALEQDLNIRLRTVEAGIRAGAVLPGVADELRAELLTLQQQRLQVQASRNTALGVLAQLTGITLSGDVVLVMPEMSPVAPSGATRRPELELFEFRREQLEAQRELTRIQLRPHVSAFAQAAYGRPGLDVVENELHPYGQGGVRMRWKFWDWDTARRDRELLTLQEHIVDTQEAAFEKNLRVRAEQELNDQRRLQEVLATDDALIAARERIADRAASQLSLGVITASDYLEKRNAAVQARLAKEAHRIELARAQARYRTLLGENLP